MPVEDTGRERRAGPSGKGQWGGVSRSLVDGTPATGRLLDLDPEPPPPSVTARAQATCGEKPGAPREPLAAGSSHQRPAKLPAPSRCPSDPAGPPLAPQGLHLSTCPGHFSLLTACKGARRVGCTRGPGQEAAQSQTPHRADVGFRHSPQATCSKHRAISALPVETQRQAVRPLAAAGPSVQHPARTASPPPALEPHPEESGSHSGVGREPLRQADGTAQTLPLIRHQSPSHVL